MSHEISKQHAQELLESLGYAVASIATVTNDKRADLFATFGEETLVVEAKSKAEHKEYLALMKVAAIQGSCSIARKELAWSSLSSFVEGAHRQLQATPAPTAASRIFWIPCLHDDWDFLFAAFEHRLYGTVELSAVKVPVSLSQMPEIRTCFYYDHADFLRYKDIDAVVLAGPEGELRMLVNEYGTRVQHLRQTHIYDIMRSCNALIDPTTRCVDGKALAISDSSATTPKAKWQHLLEKYGLMTSKMQSENFKMRLLVPRAALDLS